MTLLQTDSPVSPVERTNGDGMRVLFAKHELGYPRSMGHDLRCYNVMRAMTRLGHDVGLATVEATSPQALEGLRLAWCGTLDPERYRSAPLPPLPWLQKRFATYFGVTRPQMLALAAAAHSFGADVIVGMGPDIPAYMAAISDIPRVWYTGDEWVSHYSSLCNLRDIRTWNQLSAAAIWGVYERVFAPTLERIWVVSAEEQRQMRRWAGANHVDVLQNGVDADYFAPAGVEERPHTAAFWGRLDFAPNLQGLQWFCEEIWPSLRQQFPHAQFQIIGFNPGEEAYRLARVPGVVLTPNLTDLRTTVGEQAVVVMPFHSGGGVKNKLLEAAAMGKAVVCTSFACGGLRGTPPLRVVNTREDWIAAIAELWGDAPARGRLGTEARNWVVREHSWDRTATQAVAVLARTTVHP
jgi:polysaccharide biosynthesis protein PslH